MDRAFLLARLVAAIAVVLGASTLAPPAARAEETSDGTAVRSLWSTLDALWNARDAERFSDLFSANASFDFVDHGESLEGRATILRHFAERFPQVAPGVRHRTIVHRIRSVASDVVAVDGEVEISRRGADKNTESTVLRSFAIFAVMLRSTDGWRIHALRAYQLPPATSQTPLRGD